MFGFHFGRHGGSKRIDDSLDYYGAIDLESFVEQPTTTLRIFDRESSAAAGACKSREVDGIEIDAILRISEEHHLFPLDLAEHIILNDNYPNRQLILHCSHEVRHEH